MQYDFKAIAQSDGIIFTYDNQEKAIYVKRKGGEIVVEKLEKRGINEILNEILKAIFDILDEMILIENIIYCISVCIAMNYNFTKYAWLIYIALVLFYMLYVIIVIGQDDKEKTYTIKQYHSAEHRVMEHPTNNVSELRNVSDLANDCGSNSYVITILRIVINGLIITVCINLLWYMNVQIFIVTVAVTFIMRIVKMLLEKWNEKGYFNKILQPIFLAPPTDEQLELAIFGYNYARKLETESTQKTDL